MAIHNSGRLRLADGDATVHTFQPAAAGEWPAVIVFTDGMGVRSSMMQIAERIADAGYFTLLPNLFYRVGDVSMDPSVFFADAAARKEWMATVMASANGANAMRDTGALLDHIDKDPRSTGKIGVTGYCMGGRLSFSAAGEFGDRIAAAGSYHPSNLATEAPESPHRKADNISAKLYIGGAMEDSGFDDAQKDRLRQALDDAKVDYTLETYRARHGWVPTDTPVHDPAEAARHYDTLFDLLRRSLQ